MIKILVPIKRVPDPAVKLHLTNARPDLSGVRMVLNPYDEVALEEAVRIREAGTTCEVIAVTVGTPECEETLRTTLALGADQAVRIDSSGNESPFSVAKALADYAHTQAIALILCGQQSSDEESGQVGPMTAALLDWAYAPAISALQWQDGNDILRVDSQDESGTSHHELQLPAVLTTSLQLNTPRFARLPAIVAAKRKTIVQIERQHSPAPDPGVHYCLPAEKPPAKMLTNIAELASLIRQIKEKP